ncbi:MAG: DNA-binding response regulator [Thermoleophilia bacterium]|nr:DNA-binding response regulator [Thermoleophilia bacterium]
MSPIRTCVLVDDHTIVRDGIRTRLSIDPSIEIVGEAADGIAGLELIRELQPDFALVDLRMPKLDGFGVAAAVREAALPTRIVLFSGFASPDLVERGFAAGIAGYVCKEAHKEVLLAAIEVVLGGERYVDPTVAAKMVTSSAVVLTPRERDVLELLGDGLSNIAIAARLELAPETVRHHVSGVLRKLEATSRTEAVSIAFRSSLLM